MKQLHTHYDNLKVARDAPPEVIRAAYKTLSHKFHPDRHGGSAKATQTFQLIHTAYEVLSDPERRRKHDAWIARAERNDSPPHAAQEAMHKTGALHGTKDATVAAAAAAVRPWNGRERRRKTAAGAAGATRSVSRHAALGWRMPGITTVLWASVALVGAMLVLLFQQ